MAEKLTSRFKKAWNVFFNKDPTLDDKSMFYSYGGSSLRPDRPRLGPASERTIIASIYNRLAIDVAAMDVKHVKTDENGRFVEVVDSGLNECLSMQANIDQNGRAFIQDVAFSLLEEGCVAVVPTEVDSDASYNSTMITANNILSLRTGKIVEWFPNHVRVLLYNEYKGEKEEVVVAKSRTAIIENPFYSVMNEPNSTMQRLAQKLRLLDSIDNQNASTKLDLIIQLPYASRSEMRHKQAEQRRKEIEQQLAESTYGIGYIDATEHITQLNRAVESNLMPQIEYLTKTAYGQLGLTPEILNGSADEQTMKNYMERTVNPIMVAITEELERKFLTKTARSQHNAIMAFTDPFKMVPTGNLAELVDKFTRNEILTSNEIRQIIGFKPSSDPNADVLRNKNLNQATSKEAATPQTTLDGEEEWNKRK